MSTCSSYLIHTSSSLKGIGVGLRAPHVNEILQQRPKLDWLELLADNHITKGGWLRRQAIEVAEQYPVTLHCVGMSIGSIDPINYAYLKKIKSLAGEVKPKLISDHLCWTSLHSYYSHDLLPLPYTDEALNHVAARILQIQDYLGERIAIENVSAYLSYQHSSIDEVEFINMLSEKADCLILLDINNLYVNEKNNSQNSDEYINKINIDRIAEIHLAGYEDMGSYYLDAHNHRVSEGVWSLFEKFLQRKSTVPTLIEWDHDIPEFEVLYQEAIKAKTMTQHWNLAHVAAEQGGDNEFTVSG